MYKIIHQITFSICSSECYYSKLKVNDPTKTNTDHHNGDLQ